VRTGREDSKRGREIPLTIVVAMIAILRVDSVPFRQALVGVIAFAIPSLAWMVMIMGTRQGRTR
jgi:hypothetical protein